MERSKCERRWAVILAGGDGIRLRPLTHFVAGDDRPKQFCPLLGDATLLGRTRQRVAKHFPRNRTLFVLTESHQPFYRDELADVPASQMLAQPSNRGTLPAIMWCLQNIAACDPEAVVTFFPSDHYYADEPKFMAGVSLACEGVEKGSQQITLLSAPAQYAEPGYGWIEAEAARSTDTITPFLRVKQFWEKPPLDVARHLLHRGCTWSTFVMVGRARKYLELVASATPEIYDAFQTVEIGALYAGLPVADFSAQVLAPNASRFAVFCLGDVGWSDLGDPQRVVGTLSENGVDVPWMTLWRNRATGQTLPMQSWASA